MLIIFRDEDDIVTQGWKAQTKNINNIVIDISFYPDWKVCHDKCSITHVNSKKSFI